MGDVDQTLSRGSTRTREQAARARLPAPEDVVSIGDVTLVLYPAEPAARSPLSQATQLVLGERTVLVAEPAMLRLYELIRRLASSELPVLICGESGAGKENAAFAVHHWSPRTAQPFLAFNCANISETATWTPPGYLEFGTMGYLPYLAEYATGQLQQP